MAADPAALRQLLADPAVSGLSDAAAAAQLSIKTVTPKPARVTFASVCDSSLWGFAKASAFMAALAAVKAAGGATGAQAGSLLSLLNGPGFNPADPQVPALLPGIVALSGGTITEADARAAVFDE